MYHHLCRKTKLCHLLVAIAILLTSVPTSAIATVRAAPSPATDDDPKVWQFSYNPPVVSTFSGASTYNYPIEVPPGRNGLQPQVNLSYNSRRVDGSLGYMGVAMGPLGAGWSADQIDIVRKFKDCRGTCFDDIFTLIMNGTGYDLEPAGIKYWGRFHAKDAPHLYVERRNFCNEASNKGIRDACIAAGNTGNGSLENITGDYWIVRMADGSEVRLGYTENSEQDVDEDCVGYNCDYGGQAPHRVVKRWRADMIADVHGNEMVFTYKEFDKPSNDFHSLLTEIEYNKDDAGHYHSGVTFAYTTASINSVGPRYTSIQTWQGQPPQVTREYSLTVNITNTGDMGNECGMYLKLAHLDNIQVWDAGGNQSLPATSFEYEWLNNWDRWCYHHPRLKWVRNGYGAATQFFYDEGDEYYRTNDPKDWPSMDPESVGATYRANKVCTYPHEGLSEDRACIEYQYGPYCRGERNQPCARDKAKEWATIVGHDWTAETLYDYDESVLVKRRHDFVHDNYDLLGRETQVRVSDADGVPLKQTDTAWSTETLGSTTWAHVDEVVTTDYSGGGSLSTRIVYGDYDDYGNLIAEYHYGNIAVSGDERSVHRGFYPNGDPAVWIVNKLAWENVYEGITGNVGGLALKTQTINYYDGAVDYHTPPTQGNLTRVGRGLGDWGWVHTSYDYDTRGNLISETDPNGHTTTIEYDTIYHLYPVETCGAVGTDVEQCNYVEYYYVNYTGEPAGEHGLPGQVGRMWDDNGEETATWYGYDGFGRLITVLRPLDDILAPTVMYEYDTYNANGLQGLQVTEIVRERYGVGNALRPTLYFYDGLGRLVETLVERTDGGEQVLSYTTYDGLGRTKNAYVPYVVDEDFWNFKPLDDPNRPHTTTDYDALGRAVKVENPDVTSTYQRHVASGGFLWHTFYDENQHARTSIYDALGRMVKVQEYEGNCKSNTMPAPYQDLECDPPGGEHTDPYVLYASTIYDYDVLGNLLTVTDAANNVTTMEYDPLGRKVAMDDPDMGAWTYSYDAVGNLKSQRDAKGQWVYFAYDELNRLTSKFLGVLPLAQYWYDEADHGFGIGRRTSMNDTSGSTSWTYDERGRVTQESKTIGSAGPFVTEYTYDALDRVEDMTYPDGEIVTHTYNPQGLLESVDGFTTYVENLDYDAPGRTTLMQFGGASLNLQTSYEYYDWDTLNGMGRLRWIKTGLDGPSFEDLQKLEYEYDAVGNVTAIDDYDMPGGTETQSFTYDALDRLTDIITRVGPRGSIIGFQKYSYDEIGNITSRGELLLYHYDPNHPHAVQELEISGTTVASYSYDANGNMTNREENGTTYTQDFNAENRLERVTTGGETTEFFYDGDGNRVKRVDGSGTTLYVGNHYEVQIADPPPPPPPPAPTSLDACYISEPLPLEQSSPARPSPDYVQLSWQPSLPPSGTTFRVYRNSTRIASGLPAGEYTDGTGKEGDSYYVTAVNAAGESGPSNTAQAWPCLPSLAGSEGASKPYASTTPKGTGATVDGGYLVDDFEYTDSPLDHDWKIYDGSGSLATVAGAGRPGRVLRTTTSQGVNFGIRYPADGSLDIPLRELSVWIKDSDTFVFYVKVHASDGNDYSIRYEPINGTPYASGNYAFVPVGSRYQDGTWRELRRNLDADLRSVFGVGVETVKWFCIRGNYDLDDLTLLPATKVTKYYYAAGWRVAMRVDDVVTYLHGDHLGSTSLTTCGSTSGCGGLGAEVAQQRYYPYGEERWSSGALPTDYTFTGQRNEAGLGLMDYNARFYDPYLGRFISADTIVPEPGNPQALNRYSYVLGNPLRYVDPTGHYTEDEIRKGLEKRGYSEGEINTIIYNWTHYEQHADWWSLLMEAENGDVLEALNPADNQLWSAEFMGNPWWVFSLCSTIDGVDYFDVAAFYSDNPLNPNASTRQDIILAREGNKLGLPTDDYVFHVATDAFANGIPDLAPPDRRDLGEGGVIMFGGGCVMAKGLTVMAGGLALEVPSGGLSTGAVIVGAVEILGGGAGFYAGSKQVVEYFDQWNRYNRNQSRLAPYTYP